MSPLATASGGLVLPLVLPPLLDKYGSAKVLRFYSIVCLCTLTLILPFVRGRLPEARQVHGPVNPRAISATESRMFWLKDRSFWIFNIANTLQGLAYFVPLLWLPSKCLRFAIRLS